MSLIKLECPTCNTTSNIEDYNEAAIHSDAVNINGSIPEDLADIGDWDKYKEEHAHQVLECPECQDIFPIIDVNAY